MGYEYREVKCPWCDHIFMWNKHPGGLVIHNYIIKETGEYLKEAECPKCSEVIVVREHVLEGYTKDDGIVEHLQGERCFF